MAKAAAPKKPLTKTELLANIAAATEVPKKQVAAVLEALAAEIKKSLGNKGAGMIAIPGLVKIEKKKYPGPSGPEGRAQPLQARRADGPSGQARLQQGQGAGAEAAQGHGEVAGGADLSLCFACPSESAGFSRSAVTRISISVGLRRRARAWRTTVRRGETGCGSAAAVLPGRRSNRRWQASARRQARRTLPAAETVPYGRDRRRAHAALGRGSPPNGCGPWSTAWQEFLTLVGCKGMSLGWGRLLPDPGVAGPGGWPPTTTLAGRPLTTARVGSLKIFNAPRSCKPRVPRQTVSRFSSTAALPLAAPGRDRRSMVAGEEVKSVSIPAVLAAARSNSATITRKITCGETPRRGAWTAAGPLSPDTSRTGKSGESWGTASLGGVSGSIANAAEALNTGAGSGGKISSVVGRGGGRSGGSSTAHAGVAAAPNHDCSLAASITPCRVAVPRLLSRRRSLADSGPSAAEPSESIQTSPTSHGLA